MEKNWSFNKITFIGSFPTLSQCPDNIMPEYAFIGRSNVGKSSLINMLLGRTNIARVSGKPGKTQTINLFDIGGDWRIADMPGYGYAKVSKTQRKAWHKMVETYLQHRKQLVCAFQLIDFKIDPQKIDLEFMEWLGMAQVPFAIVFTKTDRVKPAALEAKMEEFQQAIGDHLDGMPVHFMSSANTQLGRDEILTYITDLNEQFRSFVKDQE